MPNRFVSASLLSVSLVLGGICLPTARAEDKPPERPAARGEGREGFPMLQRLRSTIGELNLSDDQKTKVNGMIDDAEKQIKEIRSDATGDREEIMKKLGPVFQKLREDVGAVLNEDQKDSLRQKMQAGARELGGRMKEALAKLDLTEDQKQKVHDILENTQKAAADLREQAQNGSQEAREKLRSLMQETREKLEGALSDDQKEKLREALKPADGAASPPKPEKPSDK